MDPRKSKYQQPPISIFDKNSLNHQSQATSNDFQNSSLSSCSIKAVIDKKRSKNKKSNSSPKTSDQYIIQSESISRQTNLDSQRSSTLLGFSDGEISSQEDHDPYTTKIGGKPTWLRKTHPLSHDVIICKNCDKEMFLLFQGYVPLEGSIYDRVIYVFGCNQQKCMKKSGSFRAFRAHRKDEEYERKYQKEWINKQWSNEKVHDNSSPRSTNVIKGGLGDMLFGIIDSDDANDVNDMQALTVDGEEKVLEKSEREAKYDKVKGYENEMSQQNINKKVTYDTRRQPSWSQVISDAEKARNEKNQVSRKRDNDEDVSQIAVDMSMMSLNRNWPEHIKSFAAQYLYITEEVLEEKKNDDIFKKHWSYEEVQDLMDRDQENDNFDWSGEKYEKAILPKGYDKTFQKFSDRVAEWPDQCVRYQFDGQPLLYTHGDETAKLLFPKIDDRSENITTSKLPVCRRCESKRVFELQLMPSMLSILSTSFYIDEDEEGSDKKSIFNLGMEWGTIMIFTCKNDCEKIGVGTNEVSYYEEVVMVQYEI
ncbi:1820_t:CDS:2 [Funneliformis geosporum]|uniref:12610_t:CDS:1 n=1 Tax=Funneliformis geosporum TaxID=1117311 RepID=A0A9W4WI07_9GLOM|nr:12610_t:CDS:2 [Funneliformis geosporum]CAI2167371.1 1820_t:CDS:2 [Funneliformis geosporum]